MDYGRYRGHGFSAFAIFTHPSFITTFWFRIGTWLYIKNNIFAKIACIPIRLIYKLQACLSGIQLPLGTSVGGGIMMHHFSCIVIARSAVIGENCTIHQGVTIGRVTAGKHAGVPTLADHVVAFAGAKIIGNITLGSHTVVGANAVVIRDIPDNCVAVGVPAKVVSEDSSKCFEGMWRTVYDFD